MNITAVNLNLLLAFEALLEERSVSRAAARIGLSQPAMSNALARLRASFADPLFTRTARGMTPTSRALELAGPVRGGLAQLRGALEERPRFDPSVSTRTFRIALTDYAELVLFPHLIQRIQRRAPEVQIQLRRLDRIFFAPEVELRSGILDAAIGFFPEANTLEPGTYSRDLFVEENVCLLRKGHPLLRKRFTLRQFASAGHVGVFYRSDTRGLIDTMLASHGLRRRLQAATPHFLVAPYVVAESDLIAVVPDGLAARFKKGLPLEIRKCPLQLPLFHMRLLWHEHSGDDPAHAWLRSEIVECCAHARATSRNKSVTEPRA